jgi:hypothetical protein
MKIRYKYFALLVIFTTSLITFSCKKNFLDVSDPTVLSESIFPQKVSNLAPILIDIYGKLQNGLYSNNMAAIDLLDHDFDHGYNGATFNEFALNTTNPGLAYITNIWTESYTVIGKCNTFLVAVTKFRGASPTAAEVIQLDQMEGQVRFLRAMNYFYLVNLYGETPIRTEADKSKMGVPLWEVAPDAINSASKKRATQGEIYDFIIADLKKAETLLKGAKLQDGRVSEWAVKSLMGKAYVYSLKYTEAKAALKDVIDNSGKALVSYTMTRNMFNLKNEYNIESLFEVSYTFDPLATTEITSTGNRFPRLISVNIEGLSTSNGFGNLLPHDANIARYGFDDVAKSPAEYQAPAYKAKSKQSRLDKVADPRLYVSMFQPYNDSVLYVGQWKKILKNNMESYSNVNFKAWGAHKYTIIDRFWRDNQWTGMNFYVLRLADVYLLYAESLIKSGDAIGGLEYLNKVHRRAYDQPINTPSVYDYKTLTDRTKTVDATDVLANDPLKYERWAELFGEGNWWFDVRRFGIGAQEAAYYKRVQGGPLTWTDTKYALPIPTSEINSNSLVVQNP